MRFLTFDFTFDSDLRFFLGKKISLRDALQIYAPKGLLPAKDIKAVQKSVPSRCETFE